MWFILVAVITANGLNAQLVPDVAYSDKKACEAHVEWGKKTYPEDYLDGTIAVCIYRAIKPKPTT